MKLSDYNPQDGDQFVPEHCVGTVKSGYLVYSGELLKPLSRCSDDYVRYYSEPAPALGPPLTLEEAKQLPDGTLLLVQYKDGSEYNGMVAYSTQYWRADGAWRYIRCRADRELVARVFAIQNIPACPPLPEPEQPVAGKYADAILDIIANESKAEWRERIIQVINYAALLRQEEPAP